MQLFLRTYAKDEYTEDAMAAMDRMSQNDGEGENSFADRITAQARVTAGVYFQQELITRFMRGLRADVRALLRSTRKNFTGPDAFA